MRTYLSKKYDCPTGQSYWKLKIKTVIPECLTDLEIFELEDIIEKYLKEKTDE